MRLRTGHASLQFTDSGQQKKHDIEKIFDRAIDRRWAWITGTEAGPDAGVTGSELMETGREAGYRMWVPSVEADGIAESTDCWTGVREDLIDGGYNEGYLHAFGSSRQVRKTHDFRDDKHWGPKGLVHVDFFNKLLGEIHVGVVHYITEGRTPNTLFWNLNKKLAGVALDWAEYEALGDALAFLNGDFNMDDSKNQKAEGDFQLDPEFESLADELKKWRNTGHGPIDGMLSYSKDKRVKGQRFTVLDDKDLFLHQDHYLLEGVYSVEPRKR